MVLDPFTGKGGIKDEKLNYLPRINNVCMHACLFEESREDGTCKECKQGKDDWKRPDEHEALLLARITSNEFLPLNFHVGTKLPIHCSALGKVLIAMSSDTNRQKILKKLFLSQITPNTTKDINRFKKEINNN